MAKPWSLVFSRSALDKRRPITDCAEISRLDTTVHGFTSPPTQVYVIWQTVFTGQKTQPTVSKYWRRKLQKKTQRTQRKHKIHIQNSSPSVYSNMGWVEDGSHREQGCQAWTVAGLKLVDSSWPCSRLAADGIDNQYYKYTRQWVLTTGSSNCRRNF